MGGVGLRDLLIVALAAAAFSFVFGYILARLARKWEEKRHAIRTVEHFCDALLQDGIDYWSGRVDRDNRDRMQAVARKMGVVIFHLSGFIHQNFPGNTAASSAIGEVDRALTGGDFAVNSRPPDIERMQISASALVRLRFAVQGPRRTAGMICAALWRRVVGFLLPRE